MQLVLASSNKGKIAEISALLNQFNIEVIPQSELGISDAEETGLTFVENALIKARHASRLAKLPAIGDDSGLVVDALNGVPGIYTARYAGINATSDDNIEKLLMNMKTVPEKNRQAHFYCALVFMTHELDPAPMISEGKWSGSILHAKQGTDGFGYDPIFFVPTLNKSAAELSIAMKNKISHRGLALQALIKNISEKLCTHSMSKI